MTTKADLHAQIRDLMEEREGLLADLGEAERTAEHWEGLWTVAIERAEAAEAQAIEIRRMGNHPAGKGMRAAWQAEDVFALRERLRAALLAGPVYPPPTEQGRVEYEIEVIPHDWANDGMGWERGCDTPVRVAQVLRNYAAQVETFTPPMPEPPSEPTP